MLVNSVMMNVHITHARGRFSFMFLIWERKWWTCNDYDAMTNERSSAKIFFAVPIEATKMRFRPGQ